MCLPFLQKYFKIMILTKTYQEILHQALKNFAVTIFKIRIFSMRLSMGKGQKLSSFFGNSDSIRTLHINSTKFQMCPQSYFCENYQSFLPSIIPNKKKKSYQLLRTTLATLACFQIPSLTFLIFIFYNSQVFLSQNIISVYQDTCF